MDIEYLLRLQEFREGAGAFLTPVMEFLTDFSVSCWIFLIVSMIYWAADRKAGRRILFGFSLGVLLNGFLKLTFCVERPWIRSPEIRPCGTSSGYSFPSGHSTYATALYGGIGIWQYKKRRWIAVLACVLVLLTMFSRNFLGMHTPQDVICGMLATLVMMYAAYRTERYTDADPKRDLYVLAAGVVLGAAVLAYYLLKPYPPVRTAGGTVIDPLKKRSSAFGGIGLFVSYVICGYFERRGYDFEAGTDRRTRLAIGAVCGIPLVWWLNGGVSLLTSLTNADIGRTAQYSVAVAYVMLAVPRVMKCFGKKPAEGGARE